MTSVGPTGASRYREDRRSLIADRSLDGAGLRRELCTLTDVWLRSIFTDVLVERGATGADLALVGLGGYGRGELLPGSDLDLLVVYRRSADQAAAVAEATWYPIWDAGVALGHSVRSVTEATRIVAGDVESATAMLDRAPPRGGRGPGGRVASRGGRGVASGASRRPRLVAP